MQKWDFSPGTNFAESMHSAIKECERLILVLSDASLKSKFVAAEWAAFFAKDPVGSKKLLVPVRIDDCIPDGLLGQIVYVDLLGLGEEQSRTILMEALGVSGAKRRPKPLFPGTKASATTVSGPTFPGSNESDLVGASVGILSSYFAASAGNVLPTIRRRALGRIFVERHLQSLIEAEKGLGNAVSIISLDVDGMSGINTRFGVDIGDAIVERILHHCEGLPDRLLVGRMGDDTVFVLISSRYEHDIAKLAGNIVRKISKASWGAVAQGLYVHCSAGFAIFYDASEPAFETVLRAIEGQLSAKKSGGNRAVAGPEFSSADQDRRNRASLERKALAQLMGISRRTGQNWPIS